MDDVNISHDALFAVPGYALVDRPAILQKAGATISGYDTQLLEIQVAPQQSVMAEPGSFQHCKTGAISISANMYGGCGQGCLRACCAAEKCCLMSLKNNQQGTQIVGISPNFPARIVPLDLSDPNNQGLYFKNGALLGFMSDDFRMEYEFAGCLRGCCGGMGCCYQKIYGSGFAFLNAGGFVAEKELAEGEVLITDEASVVAWESSLTFTLKSTGGFFTCCCGGEGLFFAKFKGPGKVYLQTMSFEKYKAALMKYAPRPKGGSGSGGSSD